MALAEILGENRLQEVARTMFWGNVFAELMQTVKVASLGQITDALFEVGDASMHTAATCDYSDDSSGEIILSHNMTPNKAPNWIGTYCVNDEIECCLPCHRIPRHRTSVQGSLQHPSMDHP